MLNSLDALVIVFMALAAFALLSVVLMFLIKHKTVKNVCFYVVCALALYVSTIGLRIGLGGWFTEQIGLGVITALMSVGAVVLSLFAVKHENPEKLFLPARIAAAASLALGLANAFFI